jgi:Domain of unknown function (DUF4189)
MTNCAQYGNDCEVAVWYQRQCAAVVSDAGATYYWGLGDGTPAAVAEAQTPARKMAARFATRRSRKVRGEGGRLDH